MNEKDIKALRWENQNKQLSLGNGLYLRIKKTTKVYVIRKMIKDKNQVITLGDTSILSLKEAKHKASQFSMKRDISTIVVSTLVEEYFNEIVVPSSKVIKQVIKKIMGLIILNSKFPQLSENYLSQLPYFL